VARRSDAGDSSLPAVPRKTVVAVVLVLTVLVVGGVAVALAARGNSRHASASAAPPVQTAKVARTDLSDSQTLDGTLGFGPEQTVKGTGSGTVTQLPAVGATATRGKALYWVDDRPVPVFFGGTPLFRPLDKAGIRGSDVKLVLDNLKALGYRTGVQPPPPTGGAKTGAPPQATLTPDLVAALKKWQAEAGLDPTGTLGPGQVAVLPGEMRVSAVKAHPGDEATSELLALTSTTKLITVPVEATQLATIATGLAVTVTLPSAKEIAAQVTSISQTVQSGAPGAPGQSGPPKVDVIVSPSNAADVANLDAAPVQVRYATTTHKGILAVPVGALVALREGGYALQRRDGTLIAVETGMFAKGLVEVSGTGVSEGLDVVTTS
jgi:hypothetical protein